MKFLIKLSVISIILAFFCCGCCLIATAAEVSPLDSPEDQKNGIISSGQDLILNNHAWHYDSENDVYWQIGNLYCSDPQAPDYENLAVYVPGAYFDAVENDDGTFTCTISQVRLVNGYNAQTAPIVFPMNTGGYSAQAPATSYNYNGIGNYTNSGFVYVYAGLRGRNNGYDSNGSLVFSGGAPWGVTDLKAAVRYYRLNQDVLPGNTSRIFVFGMSSGGAQTAVMAASGDSELYSPYLESIGAAMSDSDGNYISDAIFGAMCWCPITSLDYADAAYEWNMGQFFTTNNRVNTSWTSALSSDLAHEFAVYINSLNLKDGEGNSLTLEESESGIFTSGSYYKYMGSIVEESLNNFLSDTTFPYTTTSGGYRPDGGFGGGAQGGIAPPGGLPMGIPPGMNVGSSEESGSITYNTVQEYIDSLNTDTDWITYDPDTNTAKISGMEAFVTHLKKPSKSVPAFDDLNRTQAENFVFGNDESDALHFDAVVAGLLQKNENKYATYDDWNLSIIQEYQIDLNALDKFGNGIAYRQNMYTPMYYLSDLYEGYRTSTPAPYWRIRSGINQGDTALTVETNLALVLSEYDGVKGVDFETIWGQGHTTAERTGTSTDNFIKWVNACVN